MRYQSHPGAPILSVKRAPFVAAESAVRSFGHLSGQAVASWATFPRWRIRIALPNGSRTPMSVP
jgi:hypothetical protein